MSSVLDSQQAIYLRQSGKVLLDRSLVRPSPQTLATLIDNLHALGFCLTKPLWERLKTQNDSRLGSFYREVLPVLQEMVGAHRSLEPFYPNFPRQVMEAEESELIFNALAHYFGFAVSDVIGDPSFRMMPEYEKARRPQLAEPHELRPIDLGDERDFDRLFKRLVGSHGSLSAEDRQVIGWFGANRDVAALMPAEIPYKENLAVLVAALPDLAAMGRSIRTAVDVLRVACALSGGDVSLAEPTRFISFPKRHRRILLGWLENCPNLTEDMLRWPERFKSEQRSKSEARIG